jgi:hypothetical protein
MPRKLASRCFSARYKSTSRSIESYVNHDGDRVDSVVSTGQSVNRRNDAKGSTEPIQKWLSHDQFVLVASAVIAAGQVNRHRKADNSRVGNVSEIRTALGYFGRALIIGLRQDLDLMDFAIVHGAFEEHVGAIGMADANRQLLGHRLQLVQTHAKHGRLTRRPVLLHCDAAVFPVQFGRVNLDGFCATD